MVIEQVRYVCEFCKKAFTTREEAEDCESRCQRLAEFPRLEELNFSNRTFNLLYWSEVYTLRDLSDLSEQELLKIVTTQALTFQKKPGHLHQHLL